MTTPIKGNAPDFIASAFYLLGYRPSECVIVLGLRPTPTGFRTGGATARVDLPPSEHRQRVAGELAQLLVRTGCQAGLLIVVTTRPVAEARAVGRFVAAAAEEAGIQLVDQYHVDGESYRSLECADARCCPKRGRPLREVLDSPAAAAYVAEGMTLVGSEAELISDVAERSSGDGAADHPRRTPREWLEAWFRALDGDDRAARLPPGFADALQEVSLRDAVLLGLSGGSQHDALASLEDDTDLEGFMTGRPERERDARADRLLAAASREATVQGRAEVLGVLAWLAWWQGSGARSRLLVEEAQGLDPDHRLTGLVEAALLGAVPPPWAALETVIGR